MKKSLFFLLVFILQVGLSQAQGESTFSSLRDFSVGAKAYPTGKIADLQYAFSKGDYAVISLGVGYNWFDRADFPKAAGINDHDSEMGYGWGFSVGYNRYLKDDFSQWYFGVQLEQWLQVVRWKTITIPNCPSDCLGVVVEGHSDVLVLQPTAKVGYMMRLGDSDRFFVSPEISGGYEFNAKVDGEPTGFGFIGLVGIRFGLTKYSE